MFSYNSFEVRGEKMKMLDKLKILARKAYGIRVTDKGNSKDFVVMFLLVAEGFIKIKQEFNESKIEEPDRIMNVLDKNFQKALDKKHFAVVKFAQVEQEILEEAKNFKDPRAEIAKLSLNIPGGFPSKTTEENSVPSIPQTEHKTREDNKQTSNPPNDNEEENKQLNVDVPNEYDIEDQKAKQPHLTSKYYNKYGSEKTFILDSNIKELTWNIVFQEVTSLLRVFMKIEKRT